MMFNSLLFNCKSYRFIFFQIGKMRICAVVGCSSSTYQLDKWKKKHCKIHNSLQKDCTCSPPFVLYPFPTEHEKNKEARREWVKAIYRKDKKTGKNWQPKEDDRVCSLHFVEGKPTDVYPYPLINIPGKPELITRKRKPPKQRHYTTSKKCKKEAVVEAVHILETTDSNVPQCGDSLVAHGDLNVNVIPEISFDDIQHDHNYLYKCNCDVNCSCPGCIQKHKLIQQQKSENQNLKYKLDCLGLEKDNLSKATKFSPSITFLATDSKVNIYTGLPSKKVFNKLLQHLSVKAKAMRYWHGSKKLVSTKVRRHFRSTPKKSGRARKLTVKEEFLMVLLKLRRAVCNEMLADIFQVSTGVTSSILNSWIKFLARELKPLIYWPSKEIIRSTLPLSLKHYPNLRCTIDCSEIFIGCPRNLEIQALTWSDYKKHNTVKFLIGIAPNGMISFLSKAWGGRASDQFITRESGFLDLLEPTDLIMADRGFTIREDLMRRHATLEIPPPSSGLDQMTRENVQATKKIANAQIHVERAIGRMKQFCILQNVLPITLVPVIDDILTICACLCNLQPPLVL